MKFYPHLQSSLAIHVSHYKILFVERAFQKSVSLRIKLVRSEPIVFIRCDRIHPQFVTVRAYEWRRMLVFCKSMLILLRTPRRSERHTQKIDVRHRAKVNETLRWCHRLRCRSFSILFLLHLIKSNDLRLENKDRLCEGYIWQLGRRPFWMWSCTWSSDTPEDHHQSLQIFPRIFFSSANSDSSDSLLANVPSSISSAENLHSWSSVPAEDILWSNIFLNVWGRFVNNDSYNS